MNADLRRRISCFQSAFICVLGGQLFLFLGFAESAYSLCQTRTSSSGRPERGWLPFNVSVSVLPLAETTASFTNVPFGPFVVVLTCLSSIRISLCDNPR